MPSKLPHLSLVHRTALLASLALSVIALPLTAATSFAAPGDEEAKAMVAETSHNLNVRMLEMKGQIQSINEELSSQRANLGALSAEIVASREESDEFRRNLLNELKALRRQNQSLLDSFYDDGMLVGKDNMTEIKPLRNYDLQTPDGKMYLGEDEYIYVKEADATFDARIDTGAAVSSISAKNITEFERNGKKWYRFTIEANDQSIEVEAPFVRTSSIRQSSRSSTIERVVVELNIKIGDYSTKSEFTLTDRTHMQYALLVGRTLIQDIAVVDVSRDHIQGRNKDTFLILSIDDYKDAKKEGKDPNAEYLAKRASAEGQIAYPSQNYGSNLGPNSENALPVVRNKDSNTQQLEAEISPDASSGPATNTEDKVGADAKSSDNSDAKAESKTESKTDSKGSDDKKAADTDKYTKDDK